MMFDDVDDDDDEVMCAFIHVNGRTGFLPARASAFQSVSIEILRENSSESARVSGTNTHKQYTLTHIRHSHTYTHSFETLWEKEERAEQQPTTTTEK